MLNVGKKMRLISALFVELVGVAGFEPATPSSRTRCSTRLSHTPTDRRTYTIAVLARQAGRCAVLARQTGEIRQSHRRCARVIQASARCKNQDPSDRPTMARITATAT